MPMAIIDSALLNSVVHQHSAASRTATGSMPPLNEHDTIRP